MGNGNSRGPKKHGGGGRRGFPSGTFQAGDKAGTFVGAKHGPAHRRGGW